MTTEQLAQDVAAMKKDLHDLKLAVATLQPLKKPGVLSVVGSMDDFPEFDDVIAYGRYFRKTGRQPPPDWEPGDPIPEAAEGGA